GAGAVGFRPEGQRPGGGEARAGAGLRLHRPPLVRGRALRLDRGSRAAERRAAVRRLRPLDHHRHLRERLGVDGPRRRGRRGARAVRLGAALRARLPGPRGPPPGAGPVNLLHGSVLTPILPVPALAGALLFLVPAENKSLVRKLGIGAAALDFALAAWLAVNYDQAKAGFQFVQKAAWVPSLGISYQVGVDGMSVAMVLLTSVVFL